MCFLKSLINLITYKLTTAYVMPNTPKLNFFVPLSYSTMISRNFWIFSLKYFPPENESTWVELSITYYLLQYDLNNTLSSQLTLQCIWFHSHSPKELIIFLTRVSITKSYLLHGDGHLVTEARAEMLVKWFGLWKKTRVHTLHHWL